MTAGTKHDARPELGATLRAAGRPLLVPYVTGGITPDWTDYLLAYQDAGADAIEIGLPFSDPMLDGATIQQASDRALARGATVDSILADLSTVRLRVPIAVMTYANIVLRRGITQDKELWQWRKTVVDGKAERRNGSIVVLDDDGTEVVRWNFVNAWICKWEGPALNAQSNEVAIESIEIAHEGLELAT